LYFNTPVTALLIAVCICAPVAKLAELEVTVPVIAFTTGSVPEVTAILFAVPLTLVTPALELVPAPIDLLLQLQKCLNLM